MDRTLQLRPDIVRHVVPSHAAGIYLLGRETFSGFSVGYVGRSDTNLRRRLLQHARAADHSFFAFQVTDTIFEAFRLECREWHRFSSLANRMHPDAPRMLPYLCPYCLAAHELKSYKEGVQA